MAAYSKKMIEQAISNASRCLGYGDLTEEQREAVTHFVSGQDVFISLPTGAGKSLCYALLPFVFDFLCASDKPDSRLHHSIVMVVSPLKSLMEDQVAKFSSRGMKCASIGSDDLRTKEGILAGDYQLIFISPEAMLTDLTWREMFRCQVYQKTSLTQAPTHLLPNGVYNCLTLRSFRPLCCCRKPRTV